MVSSIGIDLIASYLVINFIKVFKTLWKCSQKIVERIRKKANGMQKMLKIRQVVQKNASYWFSETDPEKAQSLL